MKTLRAFSADKRAFPPDKIIPVTGALLKALSRIRITEKVIFVDGKQIGWSGVFAGNSGGFYSVHARQIKDKGRWRETTKKECRLAHFALGLRDLAVSWLCPLNKSGRASSEFLRE